MSPREVANSVEMAACFTLALTVGATGCTRRDSHALVNSEGNVVNGNPAPPRQYEGMFGMRLGYALAALILIVALFGPAACGRADAPAGERPRAGIARFETAEIKGERYRLEIAADEPALENGLAGRSGLSPDGGMLFVFPLAQEQMFVMKDCAEALDLIFLDQGCRVLSVHAMLPEAPRGPGESADDAAGNAAYTARLKGYSSDAPARYAIEVKGGSVARLGLKAGDAVHFGKHAAPGEGAGGGD